QEPSDEQVSAVGTASAEVASTPPVLDDRTARSDRLHAAPEIVGDDCIVSGVDRLAALHGKLSDVGDTREHARDLALLPPRAGRRSRIAIARRGRYAPVVESLNDCALSHATRVVRKDATH